MQYRTLGRTGVLVISLIDTAGKYDTPPAPRDPSRRRR